MGLFSIVNRDTLESKTLDEFEQLTAKLSGWATKEHNDDGTHAGIAGNLIAGGLGTFSGQHRVFAKASGVTLTTDTETILSWVTPNADGSTFNPPLLDIGWNVGGIFDPAHPTLFTARVDGLYIVSYAVRFAGNATGSRYAFLSTVGAADFAQDYQGGHATGNTCHCTMMLPLKVGQSVYCAAQQASGGNLAIVTGFLNSWFQMTKVG